MSQRKVCGRSLIPWNRNKGQQRFGVREVSMGTEGGRLPMAFAFCVRDVGAGDGDCDGEWFRVSSFHLVEGHNSF